MWLITGFGDDQSIAVQAHGQTETWNEALRQAGLVERGTDV